MQKVLFIGLLAVVLGFSTLANAALYDDFNNGIIDSDKWTMSGSSTSLFSEHDGRLYFNNSGAHNTAQSLLSNISVSGDVRLGMGFYNFNSTSTAPDQPRQGAAAVFTLGTSTNSVEIARSKNTAGEWLSFVHIVNNVVHEQERWRIPTDIMSGSLGLHYDGNSVFAAYSHEPGVGPDGAWHPFGGVITPGWTGPVQFWVTGAPGASGDTTFQIDNVGYSSVPVPPSLLLLAPGLAGLIAVRRRFKK